MEPPDADAYFGRVLRGAPKGTRLAKAAALCVYFEFVELRHKAELHAMTGRVVECPIDEMNRPRGGKDARLRVPPLQAEIEALFTGWAQELATCRKFASYGPQLHRGQADGRYRGAGQRGPPSGPG